MKDNNGIEIQPGDLMKRCGYVRYAPDGQGDDGRRFKVSKKTWLISKVEGDTLFYKDEGGNDISLTLPKDEGVFLVVGRDEKFLPEYAPVKKVVRIDAGSVGQKYRVHGDIPAQNWNDGDIVLIHGKVAKETFDSGKLELVPPTVEHQHVLIVAGPVKVFGNAH